jgi:hypothetical protein
MIRVMERLKFAEKTLIRTDPDVKDRFKTAVVGLGRRSRARFDGQAPTMENTNAALWNWFAGLPREQAELFLAEQFKRLEAAMRGEPFEESSAPAAVSPTKVISRKPRSEKGVG